MIGSTPKAARFWSLLLSVATLLLMVACEPSGRSEANSLPPDPEAAFVRLEERLVQSRETGFDFHVTAEGAIGVDLQGSLYMGSGDAVTLTAVGEFAGERVDLHLVSDGRSYEFGSRANLSSGPTPSQLKEAILIGFTRMGILHNLARLSAGAPPDRANGGVGDWVLTHGYSFEAPGGPEEQSNTMGFSLTVGGAPAGTASLELDRVGMPVLRRQTVPFPGGGMRVVERYWSMRVRP